MHLRSIACLLIAVIFMMAAPVLAQSYPPSNGGYPQPVAGNVQPNQPVQPNPPTLVPRGQQPGMQQPGMQQPQPPQPPTLTPQEQAQVDRVLQLWEQRNREVKTFDSRFKRWTYDTVFGRPDQPKFIDLGTIKYAAPDRGMFRVDTTIDKNGREVPIEDTRAEHWISDGKSIFEMNHLKRQMIEHKLPPELQGKAIVDTPLPFLFGADAQKLRDRYFLRLITPADVKGEIWLEAYPRYQRDAASFHHAQLIIVTQGMKPHALKLIQPNAKDCVAYVFFDVVVNDPLRMFRGNPFRASLPSGWRSIVEEAPGAQARRVPNDGRR